MISHYEFLCKTKYLPLFKKGKHSGGAGGAGGAGGYGDGKEGE